jgi:hypothetical protein
VGSIREINSRIIRWAVHVERTGEREREREEVYTGFWRGNLRNRDHLEDAGVDERILKRIFKKCDGEAWTGLNWLRIGTGDRCLLMR